MVLLDFFIGKTVFVLGVDKVAFFVKRIVTVDSLMYENYFRIIWVNIHSRINSIDLHWNFFTTTQSISINYSSWISLVNNEYLIIALAILSLLYILILVFKNLEKDIDEYELESFVLPEIVREDSSNDLIIRNKVYMSKEKESAILTVLINYEEEKFFLKKDVSLNQLANISGINEKYIAYVIKKHRGKDFSTYINELRVSYIVDCLKINPVYLQYKISYLASQCGFTSHSGFSITFKKVVGMSPSAFIANLKNKSTESFV